MLACHSARLAQASQTYVEKRKKKRLLALISPCGGVMSLVHLRLALERRGGRRTTLGEPV